MKKQMISTRDESAKKYSYTDVLLAGLAPDGGLYVPEKYPQISKEELENLRNATYYDIAFTIKKKLIGDAIDDSQLKKMIKEAYLPKKFIGTEDGNVVPLKKITKNLYIENLSLGPTAAFKDMALQQLAQEMNFELKKRNEKLVILGATSGDTGSSAEAAFKGLDNVKLFILSPEVGMSDFQKAQMGSLSGGNIFNISVRGRFDDCQDLVKLLKGQEEFSKLGAINSINWGRISSQVPYYFAGYLQAIKNVGEEVDFVVPTGNFGNVLSGYIAKQMGLPIRRLIVATNENDVLDKLFKTGVYELTPAQITSSPSMDISKASNYERLVFDLFDHNAEKTKRYMQEFAEKNKVDFADYGVKKEKLKEFGFESTSSNHKNRMETIRKIYNDTNFIIDTHTADAVFVAYKLRDENTPTIVMSTALPVKFEHSIEEALGFVPKRPERFENVEKNLSNSFKLINNNPEELKEYIRKNIKF